MPVKVVIGSNFGDEGKGNFTDYFSRQTLGPTVVVRFNGGAQAGHTVVTPEGKRHVFHHLGAGTLAGADTYLSRYFIVNPILLVKEIKELMDKGIRVPKIMIDSRCSVSTPYDMILNDLIEHHRDKTGGRHGSCGCGINETIVRGNSAYPTPILSILSTDFADRVRAIRDEYVPIRLKELGIDTIPDKYKNLLSNDRIPERYVFESQEIACFIWRAALNFTPFSQAYENIVFEGAQGMLLDEESHFFPHVTRSSTGLKNVVSILQDSSLGIPSDDVEVVYVTRSYMTRHGNGPFPTETGKPYQNIVDTTNVPNEFQGTLRFGILDVDLLVSSLSKDLARFWPIKGHSMPNPSISLAITCLDQCDPTLHYKLNEQLVEGPMEKFLTDVYSEVRNYCRVTKLYTSWGPTHSDVKTVVRDSHESSYTRVVSKRKIEWSSPVKECV